MTRAVDKLASDTDPSAALGSNSIVLATARALEDDINQLTTIAHNAAVAGIQTSVVAVSDRANLDQIDRIILAGQGNRRILEDAAKAKELVQREVKATTKVVAKSSQVKDSSST